MSRAVLLTTIFAAAMVGCRAPAPTYAPYGQTTVPPPVTGSIGTPAPQAAPYYQGSATTTTGSAQLANQGWRAPAANLGTANVGTQNLQSQPLAASQPTTNSLNTTATVGNGAGPGANFTSSQGQAFNTPQVTNPAVIGNGTTTGQPATGAAVFGNGQSAQNQPWQPANTNVGTPQLLPTGAQPGGQTNPATGQPAATGQGGNGWGQPGVNSGAQMQAAPGGMQMNGMHVNDATATYPAAANSAWSMNGIKNWFQSTFGTPTYGGPQYPTQPNYGAQPIYQTQVVPASGYSTTAPTPTPLPVRGTQQTYPAPATYPAATSNNLQNMPVQPPARQWGSVPMASNSTASATVRANDDRESDVRTPAFITKGQSTQQPHEAQRYGQHEGYLWLRGQLEYSVSRRQWKLRYIPLDAPEGRMDAYGGSVVLGDAEALSEFQTGDFVMVQGRIASGSAGQESFAPLYEVQSVSKL